MQLRRKIALSAGALLFIAPALSACGFGMATDRVNEIVVGTDDKSGRVDVLNAVLASAEAGSARFVATFSNNDADKTHTVTGIEAGEGADVQITGFTPVELAGNGLVAPEKSSEAEVIVTGDAVEAGGHVRIEVTFDDGHTARLNVPVVAANDDYEGWGPGGASAPKSEHQAPEGH